MDNEIDDDQDLEPSKFLLPTEGMETANIPSIDPETHARLEALLEAAGKYAQKSADNGRSPKNSGSLWPCFCMVVGQTSANAVSANYFKIV